MRAKGRWRGVKRESSKEKTNKGIRRREEHKSAEERGTKARLVVD